MRASVLVGCFATFTALAVNAQTLETEPGAADKAIVGAAMKRSDDRADKQELEKLPLPDNPFRVTSYALSFQSAWRNQSAGLHKEQDAILHISALVDEGAASYYYEWGCRTGREQDVANKLVELLPRVVSTYPDRLLLKDFIVGRSLLGYDFSRVCHPHELVIERRNFATLYREVSELRSTAK